MPPVRFEMTHHFDVPRPVFERWLNDPELIEAARTLPNLRHRELDSYREEGPLRIWRFRNSASGEIPAAAAKVVRPEMLAWIEESVWDPAKHAFAWRIEPAHFADRFTAAGAWTLHEAGPTRTRRVIDGEIRVHVPLVGRLVEEFILTRVRENFEAEAEIQKRFYATKV